MASGAGGAVHSDPRRRRALCRDDSSRAAARYARCSVRHGHAAPRDPGRADAVLAIGRDDVSRLRCARARARGDRPLQRDGVHRLAAHPGDGRACDPRRPAAGPRQARPQCGLAGRRRRHRDRGRDRARRGSVGGTAAVPGVAARSARVRVRGGGAAGHDGVGELRALAAGGAGRSDGGVEVRVMDALLADLRYALRTLAKSPGFTLVAVLTLALGVGANSLLFSVIYAELLRPLPYPEPGRIVSLGVVPNDARAARQFADVVPHTAYFAWRDQSRSFAALTAYRPDLVDFGNGVARERVRGADVTAGFFSVLGVHPAIGRSFTADDELESGPPAVVLSYGLGQERFGGDRSIVGRAVDVDGAPATVVGVLPVTFGFPLGARFWRPLRLPRSGPCPSPAHRPGKTTCVTLFVWVIGRLAPSVSIAQEIGR